MKKMIYFLFLLPCLAIASASLQPFVSDGCSWSPDGVPGLAPELWRPCCFEHDLTYWAGGTRAEKMAADRKLGMCVMKASYSPNLGAYFYLGVSYGGTPHLGTSFRWAYGWPESRGYQPLSRNEKEMVRGEIERAVFLSDEIEIKKRALKRLVR